MADDLTRSRPGTSPDPVGATPPSDATESAALTPMMRQYHEWKRRYPEYILLFRLGDFYEAFHEDAAVAARTLDITLTARQKIPMAGVPHHALEVYLARLVRAGLKVAICDQVEAAPVKGRQLIRVFDGRSVVSKKLPPRNGLVRPGGSRRVNRTADRSLLGLSSSDEEQ